MADEEILALFDRPAEPLCIPSNGRKFEFDVPASYLPEKYQSVAMSISTRAVEIPINSVAIKPINIPNLKPAMEVRRREPFSLFIKKHRQAAGHLITLFLGMRSPADLLSLGVYCRDRLNPDMFVYALSIAIIHRPDTKHLQIPYLVETFPGKFLDSSAFSLAVEEANALPAGQRRPIEIPMNFTATDHDPEHRVAYWREDIGINLHHWHWHLVYPFNGPETVVRKDRRGELFYYMHQQMLARYNAERLCNQLSRVTKLDLDEPIPEGYFPKLDSTIASRIWPGRPAMAHLHNLNRASDQLKLDKGDLKRWKDRLMDAIHSKMVRMPDGTAVPLTDDTGIDVLGNMVEATSISPNHNYYGDYHNSGHILAAFCHDPDNRYLEFFGVMGDTTTAMRDPIFYRWHTNVNEIFMAHKDALSPYTVNQLTFPGITVSECRVNTVGVEPNILLTHWSQNDLELANGLDFAPRGSILARITHLNNRPFSYTIIARNANSEAKQGTVRVFIAPSVDEAGLPFTFAEQKNLMIEMDRFTVNLNPGTVVFERQSHDSAVTIPLENTFHSVRTAQPPTNNPNNVELFNYCGCGWPQHMFIPKGKKSGFDMDLFVMISDYNLDKIVQAGPAGCRVGAVFCGLRDRKYPDARPMGYPFDRVGRRNVTSLDDFLTPNMRTAKITIQFTDTILPPPVSDSNAIPNPTNPRPTQPNAQPTVQPTGTAGNVKK